MHRKVYKRRKSALWIREIMKYKGMIYSTRGNVNCLSFSFDMPYNLSKQ